jgi:signal transduction histidine kinase
MLLAQESGAVACLARRNYTGYRPPLWPDSALLALYGVREVPALSRRRAVIPPWLEELPAPARALLIQADIRLMVPLREDDRTTAVLLLGEKASGIAYTPEDIDLLRGMASQIALALRSARLNQEFLRTTVQELTTGSVGFIELVEKERRLLAADLHDQTLPELRHLLTDLQSLASGEQPAASEREVTPEAMAEQVRQTIQNIRDIMESLRPSALEMLGLIPSMESELRKSAARARPPLVPQFEVEEDTPLEGLSAFAEMSLFRIVQEAVNNACRHSGGRTVRVQIGREEDEWTLRVDDDGNGLPPATERGRGRGLDNMQYRAHLIGARLTWGAPDWKTGTRVELRLPLQQVAGDRV